MRDEMVQSKTTEVMLFNHSTSVNENSSFQMPSTRTSGILVSVFKQRVDAIFKILHWPSVTTTAEIDVKDTRVISGNHALELSIYFTAICTLTNEECVDILLCQRQTLLQQYKQAVETAISKTNLLSSPNRVVLQAFVVYLVSWNKIFSCTLIWMRSVLFKYSNPILIDYPRQGFVVPAILPRGGLYWQ